MNGQILQGEIYYILSAAHMFNPEKKRSGTPAVVVSNNDINAGDSHVEVVFLTRRNMYEKNTHVKVSHEAIKGSTALCEQICAVSKYRVGDYIGPTTEGEFESIRIACMHSLGLWEEVAL